MSNSDKPEIVDVTPAAVLARLKDAIGSADPFTMDARIARIRNVGIGLAEAIHRADVARKHVVTLDGVASDLAQKAMVTLAEAQSLTGTEAPKRRGRPPGSANKGNATPTSDSASANGDALAD